MSASAPISQQIWDMKYRLKQADGTPVDDRIEDTWARVARAMAEAERPEVRAEWAAAFEAALRDFRFLPAGRILAGAGAGRRVTLFNCFVMGTIPDDMAGIFENLKEAALTMQQGGGIGYDFSTLRPKGAPVHGVGADASGPLTFMDVWDAMCRTVMSAGFRRGAMMGCMRCDHPDIEAFIAAKQDPGRLRMFNLSVLVTDAFMDAVAGDRSWDLVFDGRIYRSVSARALWDQIMRATYAYAEPGVIFIDRINARNNLAYCETIEATNPCLTADSWIMTDQGPRQIADLVGRPFAAVADGAAWPCDGRGFFSRGIKPVVELRTHSGHRLRLTPDHRVRKVTRRTRWSKEWEWCPASVLAPGDEVCLHDHRRAPHWGNPDEAARDRAEGYLLGLLLGDGVLKSDKAVLSAWPGRRTACGAVERPGAHGVMAAALDAARLLPHRADFAGWVTVPGRGEWRLSLGALKTLARDHGLAPGAKIVSPQMECRSSAFHESFLRGFFDADGSVQGSQEKGVSVRLSQSDLSRLEAAQRMLHRLGIASTIYRDRRGEGFARLPDGKGGRKPYRTAAQHELIVSGDNIAVFADRVGFADSDKAARLAQAMAAYRRAPNREAFVAVVESLAPAGEAEVFDAAIPGLNAFDANGLWTHNCGEQPLPPYGACLLGSINLAKLVRAPFEAEAAIDLKELDGLVRVAVRLLDDAIDVSNFPLEAQRREAQAKRRIGLGVTGLADALILCRARYGAPEALALTETWMKAIQRAAYLASSALAAEKGAFPLFDAEAYLAGETVSTLDSDVRAAIARDGVRNALLTSIAPTGTISLFADNVSGGLEPVFSYSYTRKVLMPDGSRNEESVTDYAYRLFRGRFGEQAELPAYFVSAMDLTPADHVRMQAAVQKFVDSSISKTINCPEEMSFDSFKDVYRLAYESGCKGCTTYRPNAITGSVLSVTREAAEAAREEGQAELPLETPPARPKDIYEAGGVVYMTQPLERPGVLPGNTYKVRWPDSDHAIYITLNDVIQDGRRRPFEIFINSKNMEHYAWTVALTRMISAVFRRGGDVSFVVEELKAVFDPRGGQWMNGRYVPSLLAAIGEVIERHLIAIGFIARPEDGGLAEAARLAVGDEPPADPRLRPCPRCSSPTLMRQEGCDTCFTCGYSKCG